VVDNASITGVTDMEIDIYPNPMEDTFLI